MLQPCVSFVYKKYFGFSFAFPFSCNYSVYTDFQEFQDEELYQEYPSNLPSYGVLKVPSCSPPSLRKDSSMCLIKDSVKLIAELVKINKKYIPTVSRCSLFMLFFKCCLSGFFPRVARTRFNRLWNTIFNQCLKFSIGRS